MKKLGASSKMGMVGFGTSEGSGFGQGPSMSVIEILRQLT